MTEDDYRDLVERSHQIQQLTEHPGWEFFIDRAHADMAIVQKRLLRGDADSLEKYKRDVGWFAGATHVLSLPEVVEAETQTVRKALDAQVQPEE